MDGLREDEVTINAVEEDGAIVPEGYHNNDVVNEARMRLITGTVDPKYVKERPGRGGKKWPYIPWGYFTAQLNEALGVCNWEFNLLPFEDGSYFMVAEPVKFTDGRGRNLSTETEVLVHGQLTVYIRDEGQNITGQGVRTAFGGKEFVKGMNLFAIIESARQRAFKKCCAQFGMALRELYWDDPDVADEMREAGDELDRAKMKALEVAMDAKVNMEVALEKLGEAGDVDAVERLVEEWREHKA
jgi:hypothetical protein